MPLAMTPTLGAKIVTSSMTSQSWWLNAADWTIGAISYVNATDATRSMVLPTGGLPHITWMVTFDDTTGGPGLNAVPIFARTGTSEAATAIAGAATKGLYLNGFMPASVAQIVPFGRTWIFNAHLPGVSHVGIALYSNIALGPPSGSIIQVTLAASAT